MLARRARGRRPGITLLIFALLLPGLLGLLGLVIDGGLLMAAHRQAQNAADAAATAAAADLLAGKSSNATATAQAYVNQYNQLTNAQVTVNVPPQQGAFVGNTQYVEVIVTNPVTTCFVQVVTGSRTPSVRARAVAGVEYVIGKAGVAVLDPQAVPGMSLSGNSTLQVNGRIYVDSTGAGWDQNNQWVNLGTGQYAVQVGSSAILQATDLEVVGGVNDPTRIQNTTAGGSNPLRAGGVSSPDPLANLAVPGAATGVDLTSRGGVNLTGGTTTLLPGVYDYIWISNTATVTFQPGIYIIKSTQATALNITGNTTVSGNGVLFYNTGSDYLQNGAGTNDAADGQTAPPAPGSATFGKINIDSNQITLQGLSDTQSPFYGMLIYQRRRNPSAVVLQGKGATRTVLGGTIYARWSQLQISGQGTFNNQFYVGSLALSGQGTLVVNSVGTNFGREPLVYLVE